MYMMKHTLTVQADGSILSYKRTTSYLIFLHGTFYPY